MVLAPFLVIYAIFGIVLLGALLLFIELDLISRAFVILGLSPRMALGVLLLSLMGSYVNIPLYQVSSGGTEPQEWVSNYGVVYLIPHDYSDRTTTIAINVGGAVIPIAVAAYALANAPAVILPAVIGTAVVALVTHRVAYPVRGVGIGLPFFVPPIVAALAAFLLTRTMSIQRRGSAVAYVGGSIGTLIGADLTNLHRVADLGAPVMSIGGAGTFDGVFLTGIVAVLLAGI